MVPLGLADRLLGLQMLAPVTREQYEIRSELEVVHLPTGAVFRAHPYSHPGDMLQSVKVYWNETGVPPEPGHYANEIQRVASQLLLELQIVDRRSRSPQNEGIAGRDGTLVAGTLQGFEIGDGIRFAAERSVEQAKLAFGKYMREAERAVSALEGQFESYQRGALDVAKQVIGFAEGNILSAFELADRIIQTDDVHEIAKLQKLFVQLHMRVLSEQMRSLGAVDRTAAADRIASGNSTEGGVKNPVRKQSRLPSAD